MEQTTEIRKGMTLFPRARVTALLRSRWPQFILRSITLAGFLLVLLTGFSGSQVGSRNFAIMFVWVGWWSALKLFMLPLGGRAWCSVCPIPMPGEWLQQGWLVQPGGKRRTLGRRWPRWLRNTWLQSAGFAAIGLFSAWTLTTPVVTAWVFTGLIVVAVVLSLVFENRTFCRYVCPMGGFIGLYSRLAPIELRPLPGLSHESKVELAREWPSGCPWINNPLALQSNANCGLCLECLRTESGKAMTLQFRPFNRELSKPGSFHLDEAVLSNSLLGSVILYTALFQGPWGGLKQAALDAGSPAWWLFAVVFLVFNFGLLPGALAGASALTHRIARSSQTIRQVFTRYSRALLPLGMFSWIAFTISFAFSKLAYLWPVLSDPFGWGWNLFGTANLECQPYLIQAAPVIEVLLMAVGLFWTTRAVLAAGEHSGIQANRQWAAAPVLLVAAAAAFTMLWLLIG